MVTEIRQKKCSFFATIVKLNGQKNYRKSFPFSRCKEKQVSLLASRKDSIFGSQKNPIKCKVLFPQWNLKTCKFYCVSNTEEQFNFSMKVIPAGHRFLGDPLVAAPDYYDNHIFHK